MSPQVKMTRDYPAGVDLHRAADFIETVMKEAAEQRYLLSKPVIFPGDFNSLATLTFTFVQAETDVKPIDGDLLRQQLGEDWQNQRIHQLEAELEQARARVAELERPADPLLLDPYDWGPGGPPKGEPFSLTDSIIEGLPNHNPIRTVRPNPREEPSG